MLEWFAKLDSKLVCDLLERWPSLEELQAVPPGEVKKFFRHRRGRHGELTEAEIELLCTSKPQHLACSTSMIKPPRTCDPGRADSVILPRVLSSHEEATVRCAKARPGSNSSAGSQAPVRSKASGPHASEQPI